MDVGGIAENLVAAAIGGGLAASWRFAGSRRASKDVRAMWSPFLHEPSCIVEGVLNPDSLCEGLPDAVTPDKREAAVELLPDLERHLRGQERSGLMGRGDHEAIVRIQTGLARAGLSRTLPVRPDHELGDHRKANLVVVGGPDANVVTRSLLLLLRCGVTISQDAGKRNGVEDLVHGQFYAPKSDDEQTQDYGILIKAPSPYQEGRYVVIIAGAHGLGSMAASQLAVTEVTRMAHLSRSYPQGFECIVSYRSSGDSSNPTEENTIVLDRPIHGSRHLDRRVPVTPR